MSKVAEEVVESVDGVVRVVRVVERVGVADNGEGDTE